MKKKAKSKKKDDPKPSKSYVGGMGEHVVMAELLARGFDVARAVVDGGIDVIAFKPANPQKLFRLQVKSGFPGSVGAKDIQRYTFTLGRSAYESASGQDYYLVLVLRDEKNGSFVPVVIPKAIFDDHKDNQDVIDWDSSKTSMQISVHLPGENGAITLKNKSGIDITRQTKKSIGPNIVTPNNAFRPTSSPPFRVVKSAAEGERIASYWFYAAS